MRKELGIVAFSVRFRVSITMFILIAAVFGGIALSRLGLDFMPDITFPMCSVVTQYPGVAPEEIEQLVTAPLEGMIASVKGVKKLTSISSEGISAITVEFEWGSNIDFGAEDIKENIGFVRDFLPKDMSEPAVFKFDLSQMPVMFLGVTGEHNTYRLRKLLKDNIVERLQRLDGVAQAAIYGGKEREIRVNIDPSRMRYRGVTIDGVVNMLRAQNMNTPAGYIERNATDFLLRGLGEMRTVDEIAASIIGFSPDGTPVRLGEIAEVVDGFKEKRSVARMDGSEAVFLLVSKRSGANTQQVCKRLRMELIKLGKEFPQVKFLSIFDQGEPIERVTFNTAVNAVTGAVLAILFMWIFLGGIRPTLMIAVAIPLSIITTFIFIYVSRNTLNLMTLGGLALGVGMLVDNAVVVIENIYRHLQRGERRTEAAVAGTSEVALAISASTFTTVIVFLPILFSQGLAAMLTRGLCLTIMFSLLASLIVALTMVPMLASVFFKEHGEKEQGAWFIPLRDAYARSLAAVLRRPGVTLVVITALLALSGVLAVKFLDTEFMPEANSNMSMLTIELPPGTTLDETQRLAAQIRQAVGSLPEVKSIGEVIGREESDRGGDAASVTGPNVMQLFVRLVDAQKRKRTSMELQDSIRAMLPALRDARIRFLSMSSFGASAKPLRILVYGKDLETLKEICSNIAQLASGIRGLKDIESSFSRGRPEYHFIINRQKALMHGVSPAQIQATLKAANLGEIATRLRTSEDEIDIRVILDERFRRRLESIAQIPVATSAGAVVPLEQVVAIRKAQGPTMIQRDNQYRMGVVDANLSGRSLGSAVKEIKEALVPISKALPKGYSIVFKGQFEDMQETFGQLLLAILIAILLVYMVMASQMESLAHPLVIMCTMPLAALGVVLILLIAGKTFSVVAFVGCVLLAGIVVNNGIVMIDFVNQLRNGGMAVSEALIEAGKLRLRPIVITAGTTVAGMIPMAFSRAEGAELRSPMALTVIGGLTTSTLLTLYVVPVAYQYVDRIAAALKRRAKMVVG